MKKMTKNLFALLPVAAMLMLSACSSENDVTENVTPEPQDPTGPKEIGFKVTVDNSTRASIAGDQKTLSFAEGDQLLITGENISGTLPMTSGAGTQSAVFTGTLTYTGEGTPASSLALTATLISSTNVGVNTTTGDVDYGTAVCATLDEAVAQYCLLTGTSTFGTGEATFHLTPHTAFLNFTATLPKGYTNGTAEPVTVTVGGSTHTGNATISVVGDAAPVVNFVIPVAAGTSLSGATVKVGRFAAKDLGSNKTTEAKVYNVNRTFASAGSIPSGVQWKQLWSGGPYFADRNIGASSETDYGSYFSWGEVSTKQNYSWETCEWGTHDNPTKYNSTDGKTTLDPEDDAAYWNWGGNCRMPTKAELQALIANTTNQWTTEYSVNGWKFIDKRDNTNYIFLPAAGRYNGEDNQNKGVLGLYWLSSKESNNVNVGRLSFNGSPSSSVTVDDAGRRSGLTVRAVRTSL